MAKDVKDDAQDPVLATLQDDGEQDTKESSPKQKPEVAKDVKEESAKPVPSEAPPEAEPAELEESPDKEAETPAEDKPPGKAEERKAQLNSEIRDLVSKRNALKQEVEKANAQVYQPATETELTDQTNPDTGQSYTPLEARVEAMRQQQEMEKYNSQVAEAQLTVSHESERVLNDFPIFNPDSQAFDKELAGEAGDLLRQNLILDPNTGQVIGSTVSPYQLYQTIARAHQTSTVKGQIQGQAATEQMLANADSPGNVAPPQKAKDPILDILKSDDY